MIVEESNKHMVMMSRESKLMQSRILFLDGVVDEYSASDLISGLLYLDSINHKEITLFINSVGGQVYDGLAIVDAMNRVKSPIKTVAIGKAMSMGAVILINGDIRQATKHATIMLHEPQGGFAGYSSDVKLGVTEMERVKEILNGMIDEKTGIREEVGHDNFEDYLTRDRFIDPETALKMKIIDVIL